MPLRTNHQLRFLKLGLGYSLTQMTEALRYKPEDGGLDFR